MAFLVECCKETCKKVACLYIDEPIDKIRLYIFRCPSPECGEYNEIKIGPSDEQVDCKDNVVSHLTDKTSTAQVTKSRSIFGINCGLFKKKSTKQANISIMCALPGVSYVPQFYSGSSVVAVNRRKHMSGNLEKLRDIPEADVVAIMGHRAPGADYASTHPPLKEIGEPDCPIRQIVAPTAGAAAGDRVRYSQWTDSMYFAPSTPYWRSYWGAINCKGCDPGTLSGRQVIEARERDIESYTKAQYDSEMTDVALCSMRGCAAHGHSLRLEENGMQFDMLDRTEMGEDGNVYCVKDQVGIPLDKKVNLGKPMTEAEAKKRTTIFRVDGIPMCGTVSARKYDEAVEALHHMWELRSKWGFRPE